MYEEIGNFERDGFTEIGDICFLPVSDEDKEIAMRNTLPIVSVGTDSDNKARYDLFNGDGNKFLGYLDLYFEQGGYFHFAERRQKPDGKYEKRALTLPIEDLLGLVRTPQSRAELSLAIMDTAKKLHYQTDIYNHWKPIDPEDLEQRIDEEVKTAAIQEIAKMEARTTSIDTSKELHDDDKQLSETTRTEGSERTFDEIIKALTPTTKNAIVKAIAKEIAKENAMEARAR